MICHGWAWLQSSLILSCYLETKLRSSEMAGVSHLRTKKEAERREIIDKVCQRVLSIIYYQLSIIYYLTPIPQNPCLDILQVR